MEQYRIYTDGTDYYRDGVRDGDYVIDMSINQQLSDFSGTENVDWANVFILQ